MKVDVRDKDDREDDFPSTRTVDAELEVDSLGLPPYLTLTVEDRVIDITLTSLFAALSAGLRP